MLGHEIDHVQSPLVPECSLFWILGPESFEWHVDECHQKQIKQEPVQADSGAIAQSTVNLYAGSAQSRRRDRQQHSSQCQNLFLTENRGNDSKKNGGHDEALDQNAHRVQWIVRTQFGRGEQLRKM